MQRAQVLQCIYPVQSLSDFLIATCDASEVFNLLTSLKSRVTHPDPVPSFVRMVTVYVTFVALLYANKPLLFIMAATVLASSQNPAAVTSFVFASFMLPAA